jgi:hypothetical protein
MGNLYGFFVENIFKNILIIQVIKLQQDLLIKLVNYGVLTPENVFIRIEDIMLKLFVWLLILKVRI